MTYQTEKPKLRSIWSNINDASILNNGPISLRITGAETCTIEDLAGSYGAELNLDQGQLKIITDIIDPEIHNIFHDVDSITISEDYIIATVTQNCVENDQEIHRLIEKEGVLIESDEGFHPSLDFDALNLMSHLYDSFERDPIKVQVHEKEGETSIIMTYAGSYDISHSDWPEKLGLTDALAFEDDESEGQIICDLHKSKTGIMCATITRDAMTPDGKSRRIIYSELRV